MFLRVNLAVVAFFSSSIASTMSLVGEPPQTPPKTTAPVGGGYVWTSPAPKPPDNNSGASVGVQYPSDKGPTRVLCNGKPR
jgi:hypothetical protein